MRYWPQLYPWDDPNNDSEETIAEQLRKLGCARIGPFRALRDDPAVRVVALPVRPAHLEGMTWQDGVGHGVGNNPRLTFALDGPTKVYAVRVRYSYGNAADGPARFELAWKKQGQEDFCPPAAGARQSVPRTTEERKVTVWVNDVIERIRIQPDAGPCTFRITGIDLWLPADGEQDPPGNGM
jgi:hypothetical protein